MEQLSYEEQLAQLQSEYVAELPGRMLEIEGAWQSYGSDGSDANALEQLHFHIHRLAGSAATFGFSQLSDYARSIELQLKPVIASGELPTKRQRRELAEQISLLLESSSDSGIEMPPRIAVHKPSTAESGHPLIYLLEDDQPFAQNLALQLTNYGFEVEYFLDVQSIEEAISRHYPDIIIADIILEHDEIDGNVFVARLHQSSDTPVIIYSSQDDFDARLKAVRAGADAYFVKPIETDILVDKIDSLLGRKPILPYRILLIDDDVSLARHLALVLSHADFQVSVVTQPKSVLMTLEDSNPELIIMDLYMPDCSGFELAKVIRQQSQFDSIPIIFLSTESDTDKQIMAMRMGGDEFLTKPIEDDYLLAAVSIRAERARLLSDLIMQDSLTGLLKHAKMKEQLAIEVARANRTNLNFAFAMIDIDHFKNVNDTYGHLTGDRVIKALAKLLRKRLRKNDIVARYGGEEFAVILQDCERKAAFDLIDAIREDFSQIVHHCGEQEFNVSISAGIAFVPGYTIAEELNQAADDALYQAKSKGRNQVAMSKE